MQTINEKKAEEYTKALELIKKETDGALDEADLFEAVCVLISQRDNARNEADHFKKEKKRLEKGVQDVYNRESGKGGNTKWTVEHLENLLEGREYNKFKGE